MKLSEYAKKYGMTYRTAFRWWQQGQIKGFQKPSGTQVARLEDYCAAKGYQVARIVKEIGSGVTDSRRKFLSFLSDAKVTTMVVEHQDRATRFGFRSLEVLLTQQHRAIEVANLAENTREDLLHDLSSLVYAMCARLYGHRRAKRKQAFIGKILTGGDKEEGEEQ